MTAPRKHACACCHNVTLCEEMVAAAGRIHAWSTRWIQMSRVTAPASHFACSGFSFTDEVCISHWLRVGKERVQTNRSPFGRASGRKEKSCSEECREQLPHFPF